MKSMVEDYLSVLKTLKDEDAINDKMDTIQEEYNAYVTSISEEAAAATATSATDENGNEIDPTVKVKITVNDETVYSDSNRKDETEIISEISGKGTVTVKVWVNEIKKITKQFDLSVDDPVLTID